MSIGARGTQCCRLSCRFECETGCQCPLASPIGDGDTRWRAIRYRLRRAPRRVRQLHASSWNNHRAREQTGGDLRSEARFERWFPSRA